jgi:two-component system response regulator MprA
LIPVGVSRPRPTSNEDRLRDLAPSLLRLPILFASATTPVWGVMVDENVAAVPVVAPPRAFEGLLGRLRALLRRDERDGADVLRFGDLRLDPGTRDVRRGRRLIELTPIEFRLLELFLRNPRRVLTRSFIFTNVWGFDFGPMSNSLNVYVGNLRRKTEAGGDPRLIHTVRGVGYVLRDR